MIRALDQGSVLTLAVEGSATMAESPAALAFARERMVGGVRTVRIDLRSCTTMDSTFSGTLLALRRQLEELGGRLTLVSPSARVIELLAEMGLEDFYEIERAEPLDGSWTVLTGGRPGTEKLQRIVLDAHDELARLPGSAGKTFRVVVDELRRSANEPAAPESNRSRPRDTPSSRSIA